MTTTKDPRTVLSSTIQDMFESHNKTLNVPTSLKNRSKKTRQELELALAVMLVDLASCDDQLDKNEYQTVVMSLRRVFGTSSADVATLVQKSKEILKNFRGSTGFAESLRNELSNDEKLAVSEVINDLIVTDGKEDGFEIYLRHRFLTLLGMEAPPQNSSDEPPAQS